MAGKRRGDGGTSSREGSQEGLDPSTQFMYSPHTVTVLLAGAGLLDRAWIGGAL